MVNVQPGEQLRSTDRNLLAIRWAPSDLSCTSRTLQYGRLSMVRVLGGLRASRTGSGRDLAGAFGIKRM